MQHPAFFGVVRLALAVAIPFSASLCAQQSKPAPAPSVTVFPILLGGSASAEVANVVGMLLERGGLQDVEVAAAAFSPDRKQEFTEQAQAFAAFARRQGLKTEYALLGDFLGSPKTGVAEVRGVLVDQAGTVVWSERQRPGQPAFDRDVPHEPMECCTLLVQRLREPLRLADPMRPGAPEGKLGARWMKATGVPTQAERDAMAARLAELQKLGTKATLEVFPPRIGTEWPAASASDLATRLEKTGLVKATAAAEPLRFEAERSSNEQRTLWSGAESIQKALRAAAARKHYALVCDFMMAPDGKVWAVHSYVLSPAGELVVVDYQNSHHDEFRSVAPDSPEKCCELAALRVAGYLR